jgi:FkbM family methyltransferase
MPLKRKIIDAIASQGVLIQKKTPLNSEEKILQYLVEKYGIDLVLDIGANKGQFAADLIKAGYRKQIVSFEPLPDVFRQLQKAAATCPQWKTENLALGAEIGNIDIHVSGNTESSSVLPMLDLHAELAPESMYVEVIKVPLTTIDAYMAEKGLQQKQTFLKIDVQGYEEAVLQGAVETLKKVAVLQLEISFVPLYANSPIYFDIMRKLESIGFSFYSFLPAFADYKTGQIFQVDGIYVKR